MHPSEVEAPELAPSPSPAAGGGSGGDSGGDSGEWGPPEVNSATELSVVSYFMTALAGLFVKLYLFV